MHFKKPFRTKYDSDSSITKASVTKQITTCLSFMKKERDRQSYTAVLVCDSETHKDDRQVTFNEHNIQTNPSSSRNIYATHCNNKCNQRKRPRDYSQCFRATYAKSYESTEAVSAKETTDGSSTLCSWSPNRFKNDQRRISLYTENDLYRFGRYRRFEEERAPTFIIPDVRKDLSENEKMTYCRPITNFYNREYIYKTMEKKKKLQKLVKQLVEARYKEKQKKAWDNYIHDLKIKHGLFDKNNHQQPSCSKAPDSISNRSDIDMLEDFYNTKFKSGQSNHCKNLLEDLYYRNSFQTRKMLSSLRRHTTTNTENKLEDLPLLNEPNPYFCYPSSSQGRMRKRNAMNSCDLGVSNVTGTTTRVPCSAPPLPRNITIHTNKYKQPKVTKAALSNHGYRITVPMKLTRKITPKKSVPYKRKTQIVRKTRDNQSTQTADVQLTTTEETTQHEVFQQTTQDVSQQINQENSRKRPTSFTIDPTITAENENFLTDYIIKEPVNEKVEQRKESEPKLDINKNEEEKKTSYREEYEKVAENVARMKEINDSQKFMMDQSLLESIENKLDLLIIAINSLIVESKTASSYSDTFRSCRKETCIGNKKISSDMYDNIPFSNIKIPEEEQPQPKQTVDESKNTNYRCNMTDCTSVRCIKRKKLAEDTEFYNDNQNQGSSAPDTFYQDSSKGTTYSTQEPQKQGYGLHRPADLQFVSQIMQDFRKVKRDVNNCKDYDLKSKQCKSVSEQRSSSKVSLGKSRKIRLNPGGNDESNVVKITTKKSCEDCKARMPEQKSSSRFSLSRIKWTKSKTKHNGTDSDEESPFGFKKGDKYFCGVVTNTAETPFGDTKIEKILTEERDKSDKAKRDIEDILNGEFSQPRAVQISFDLPTRECCTEVTDSLSRTRLAGEILEEFIQTTPNTSKTTYTIAVNTDPLSFLALLRISTDTIRQMLSYMQFDCYSLLPLIQPPRIPMISRGEQFVCNICGATFQKASYLSEHIQEHDLAAPPSRGCCVCRHLLEIRHKRAPGLFSCQYCGQCFTRAYCCELHQQECARRRGQVPDIPESLAMLR